MGSITHTAADINNGGSVVAPPPPVLPCLDGTAQGAGGVIRKVLTGGQHLRHP